MHISAPASYHWWQRRSLLPVRSLSLLQLTDRRVDFPAEAFPPGKLVTGRITSIDAASSHINLSLRRSVVRPTPTLPFSHFVVGLRTKGTVKSIKPFGLFIRLRHSTVDGLAHISECSDEKVDDLSAYYKLGDRVRCMVLRRDEERGKISLGVKAHYFEDETEEERKAAEVDSEEEEEEADEGVVAKQEQNGEQTNGGHAANGTKAEGAMADTADEAADSESKDAEMKDAPAKGKAAGKKAAKKASTTLVDDFDSAAPLHVTAVQPSSAASSSGDGVDDGDADAATSAPLTRRAKASLKRSAQSELEQRELALSDPNAAPTLPADYERLLLASPNSSYLWLRYMAHHVGLKDIDAARKVARRALDTIGYREEAEKRNVWVALIGLEEMYGTAQTVEAVVAEAMQRCDQQSLLVELTHVYTQTAKHQQVADTYQQLTKRYPTALQHWANYAKYLFATNHAADARALLPAALKKQPNLSAEIELLEKFALLEYGEAHGSCERGRTMLEGVVTAHPKRVDVWNVWIDAELKALRSDARDSGVEAVRAVLDRAIALNWSSKKMKHFMKRYLEVEREYGNESRVEYVKQKAREYVERKGE